MDVRRHFGEFLKELLSSCDVDVPQLAIAIGYVDRTIYKWLKMAEPPEKGRALQRIARAMEIPYTAFRLAAEGKADLDPQYMRPKEGLPVKIPTDEDTGDKAAVAVDALVSLAEAYGMSPIEIAKRLPGRLPAETNGTQSKSSGTNGHGKGSDPMNNREVGTRLKEIEAECTPEQIEALYKELGAVVAKNKGVGGKRKK